MGADKTVQRFHTMLSATVVADGQNRVLPLLPAFVQPQQDPAASRPELSEQIQKQDCERNAAKRWLPGHLPELRPERPVILGDDLYCRQPLCRLVLDLGADFLFVCKPNSHKRLYELSHDQFIRSTGWIKTRNRKQQVEHHRFRWMHGLPVRDSDYAVLGAWIEYAIERQDKRTYTNTFFTSLAVTADTVAEIARGRPGSLEDRGGLQLLGAPRLQPQAQLRARQRRTRQPAGGAQSVRLRAAGRPGLRRRLVAAMPGTARDPARLLRDPAGLDGVLLFPALDGLVRDDAQATPATGSAAGSGLWIHVMHRVRSRTPVRPPEPTQAPVRFEGWLAAPSAGRPPRASAYRLYTVASGTVRAPIQALKSLWRSQLHLPDLPK